MATRPASAQTICETLNTSRGKLDLSVDRAGRESWFDVSSLTLRPSARGCANRR
jgi:hypothetical protein